MTTKTIIRGDTGRKRNLAISEFKRRHQINAKFDKAIGMWRAEHGSHLHIDYSEISAIKKLSKAIDIQCDL